MILDTTLSAGLHRADFDPTLTEKVAMVKLLDDAGVDVIECGFVVDTQVDVTLLEALSSMDINASIAIACSCDMASIKIAYDAIKDMPNPFLNIYLSVGEYLPSSQQKMDQEDLINYALDTIYEASLLCEQIQFSAIDATRANREMLIKIVDLLSRYGASHLCLVDSMGVATPKLLNELINTLMPIIEDSSTILALSACNSGGLANANAKVALSCGVKQIVGSVGGIAEGSGGIDTVEIMRHLNMEVSEELEALHKGYIKRYM